MRRTSFLLTVAAGLLASLAASTPARAGSIEYLVDTTVVVTAGVATTATVDFSEPVSAPVTIVSTNLPPVVSAGSPSGMTETFTFSGAAPGTYSLDFMIFGPSSPGLQGLGGTVGPLGSAQGGVIVLSVGPVPEPASLALLGIGMAGFFTYRRLFKRTTV